MEKKLPKIYANQVMDSVGNNRSVTYQKNDNSYKEEIKQSNNNYKLNVNQKISEIFKSSKYVYKADVLITLKDGQISKKVIGKNNNNLITLDNELININDIIDIEYK